MYYSDCFLIPKIILKIGFKNFGLFTNTTFINVTPILIFMSWQTQNYNPYCQNSNQKFRRTKTAYKKSAGKCECQNTPINSAMPSHFVAPISIVFNTIILKILRNVTKNSHKSVKNCFYGSFLIFSFYYPKALKPLIRQITEHMIRDVFFEFYRFLQPLSPHNRFPLYANRKKIYNHLNNLQNH